MTRQEMRQANLEKRIAHEKQEEIMANILGGLLIGAVMFIVFWLAIGILGSMYQ